MTRPCDGSDASDEKAIPQTTELTKSKQKIAEDDFDALNGMARDLTPEKMRPLSPAMRRRWEAAKRGRPRKSPGTKAIPTMITVEPALLKQIDVWAKKAGLSRSQFLANAARRELSSIT